ncbi:MAG: DNA-processing protein DprA [Gemmatimonadaceae bacterium]
MLNSVVNEPPHAVVRPGSARWPAALVDCASAPKSLYFAGDVGIISKACVAIVGTRHPTRYGERVASDIASALASAGACIVSGLAYGIDACAHRAALAVDGATAAVLGAGIDQVYPLGHRRLYDEIVDRGVVLSEFAPGTATFKGCFPRRNRIIAGLAQLTIVIEAGAKSGALITANYALDYDRKVAAVPGPIDSPQSAGTNLLLRDGAHVIASVDDALALLDLDPGQSLRAPVHLGDDEATVWDVIAGSASSTDDLVARTGLAADRCLVAVTNLEIQGLVWCSPAGEIRRR